MVNFHQLIYALSDALDFVGVDDLNHGKRVAYMAMECIKELKHHRLDKVTLFHASLLHDCGVSSTRTHDKLVYIFDWEGARDHCVRGYQLLSQSSDLKHLSNIILYHHTHYRILKDMDIDPETVLLSNLIFLVDRVDALTAQYRASEPESLLFTIAQKVQTDIRNLSGGYFMPELVEAFLCASDREDFWFTLEETNLHRYLHGHIASLEPLTINLLSLAEVSRLFGHIVDTKSHYTANHSMDVAKLSRFIAQKLGMDETVCQKIEIAGLLHDLGKLRIPDELLEKESALSKDEFNTIKMHAYATNQILSQVSGIEDISKWASQHHEKLNGKGYPHHSKDSSIPIPARILAVADIFQALAQKRPYRDNLEPLTILAILKQKVLEGELDGNVVSVVENNLLQCWEISLKNSA